MKSKIKIPIAMQIRVDDVAWHEGADMRLMSRPSRSGLPRRHHPMDYVILNEIGKRINMKIGCSLVLCDWDKDNILRGVPHVTWNPEGWDRASEIDMEYAEKCFEMLDGGEYLDYNIHGICHGYYDNGKIVSERQYNPNNRWLSEEEFEKHIDLFFELYNSWGFKKKIESFACPCGNIGNLEQNEPYFKVLSRKGIKFWSNGWREVPGKTAVSHGIIVTKSLPNPKPWNAMAMDPDFIDISMKEGDDDNFLTEYSSHWTNYVRFNPENNLEYAEKWANHFMKQAEVFGVMLARDIAFSAAQLLYHTYAKTEIFDGKYVIDLTDVDSIDAKGKSNEFYVSLLNGVEIDTVEGGTFEEYEAKKEFRTYKISRSGGNIVKISIKK